MPAIEQQIADHLSHLVQNAMSAQSMRFREEWEPRVVRTLGGAADQCLSRLDGIRPQLQALPRHAHTTCTVMVLP